ncbi:uncharacterized protein BKA78DRAFT_363341 [Phyllosticta capitalensis]
MPPKTGCFGMEGRGTFLRPAVTFQACSGENGLRQPFVCADHLAKKIVRYRISLNEITNTRQEEDFVQTTESRIQLAPSIMAQQQGWVPIIWLAIDMTTASKLCMEQRLVRKFVSLRMLVHGDWCWGRESRSHGTGHYGSPLSDRERQASGDGICNVAAHYESVLRDDAWRKCFTSLSDPVGVCFAAQDGLSQALCSGEDCCCDAHVKWYGKERKTVGAQSEISSRLGCQDGRHSDSSQSKT